MKVPYFFYSHVVHIILLGQLFGTNFSWNIRGQFWVPRYHCGIFCPSLCYFSRRCFWIGIFCQKIEQTQTSGIWRIKLKIVVTIIPDNIFVPASYCGSINNCLSQTARTRSDCENKAKTRWICDGPFFHIFKPDKCKMRRWLIFCLVCFKMDFLWQYHTAWIWIWMIKRKGATSDNGL